MHRPARVNLVAVYQILYVSGVMSMTEPIDRLETMEQLADLIFDKPNGDYFKGVSDAQDVVAKMLTIEPMQWIPCEVRLPEEDKDVLVTVYFKGNRHNKPRYYIDIASCIGGSWSSFSDEFKVMKNRHEVVAWCELPEPYKGGDADGRP